MNDTMLETVDPTNAVAPAGIGVGRFIILCATGLIFVAVAIGIILWVCKRGSKKATKEVK